MTAPGAWPSPLDPATVVAASVGLGGPQLAGGRVWWSEARPHEGGRVQICSRPVAGDDPAVDLLPEGRSARSRAHEYGGGAWWVVPGVVVFVDAADQRVWAVRVDDGGVPVGDPVAVTPDPPEGERWRHADPRPTGDPRWWVCVRERRSDHGERDELVAVRVEVSDSDADATGARPAVPVVLTDGSVDFVANPRVAPDGGHLCWLSWDLPHMPWETTLLWVAGLVHASGDGTPTLVDPAVVLGDPDVALAQPDWLPDGRLAVVSDEDNWWNLWTFPIPGRPEPGSAHQATVVAGELAPPQWVFGQRTWAATTRGDLVGVWRAEGKDHIGVMAAGDDTVQWIHSGHTAVEGVATDGTTVALTAGSFAAEPSVAVVGFDELYAGGVAGTHVEVDVRRAPRSLGLDREWWGWPESLSVPTSGGKRTHALLYPPTNPGVTGAASVTPTDGPPPLVVLVHGGPTAAARPVLSLATQFWTSRGFAVADVNYRGSTGYGRRYRRLLEGRWGVADVEDCIAVARHLAETGRADPARMVIRGGSAGGFTTLAALATSDVFAAGVSLYGIADLELLAAETHRFESGYNDWLLGPVSTHLDEWRRRSPIHHVDDIAAPLLVLQGAEDAVVPPSQAEAIVEALRSSGVPVGYLCFDGEGHGFRRADTLERALTAEWSFLTRVLRLDEPSGDDANRPDHDVVDIGNLDD